MHRAIVPTLEDRPLSATLEALVWLVLVSVFEGARDELPNNFAVRWINHLRSAGCSEIARFVVEPIENDFLRLPVKQEEGTVVVLVEAPSRDCARRLLGSIPDLESASSRVLLLRPTPRSLSTGATIAVGRPCRDDI